MNTCTNIILPLLGIYKELFGVSNFIQSYLEGSSKLYIEVKDVESSRKYWSNINFKLDYYDEEREVYVLLYIIPMEYIEDVLLYQKGLYSQLSIEAKEKIKLNSRRLYKYNKGGYEFTDKILAGLYKEPELKKHLELKLGVKLHKDSELLSKPNKNDEITF